MKEFLKRKELIPVYGVLIGMLVQLLSITWGLFIIGGSIGYAFARLEDGLKTK